MLASYLLSHAIFRPQCYTHAKHATSILLCYLGNCGVLSLSKRKSLEEKRLILKFRHGHWLLSFFTALCNERFHMSDLCKGGKAWRVRRALRWGAWRTGKPHFGWGLQLFLPTCFLLLRHLLMVVRAKPVSTHGAVRPQVHSNKCFPVIKIIIITEPWALQVPRNLRQCQFSTQHKTVWTFCDPLVQTHATCC